MLKPLPVTRQQQNTTPANITRVCEACGEMVDSTEAINFIPVIGSPGHPSLMPFQCAHEEHWACSLECWRKVAHACIDEHMHVLLTMAHQNIVRLQDTAQRAAIRVR